MVVVQVLDFPSASVGIVGVRDEVGMGGWTEG